MGIVEILINIIFSTVSMIGMFYIYKQTHLWPALLGGVLSYTELLCRTFMGQFPIIIQGLNILVIPEILIMIYFLYHINKEGFTYLTIMTLTLLIGYILLLFIHHPFYGEVGLGFTFILLIWTSQSKHPCKVNPWACRNG